MSSLTDATVAKVQANLLTDYCVLSVIVLLFYEYAITFDQELKFVWRRKFTGATAFFLMSRYLLLLDSILTLPSLVPLTDEGCMVLCWWMTLLLIFPSLLWAAFSCLRAYILSGRSWKIATLMFGLLSAQFGINMYIAIHSVPQNDPPPFNCETTMTIPANLVNILNLISRPIARLPVLAADALVLAVAMLGALRSRRVAVKSNINTRLSTYVLRHGSLYFLVLLTLNILYIVQSVTALQLNVLDTFVSEFLDPITSIIVCRFILNLREVDSAGRDGVSIPYSSFVAGSQGHPGQCTLRFASFVEPLGAPLVHGFPLSNEGHDINGVNANDEIEDIRSD